MSNSFTPSAQPNRTAFWFALITAGLHAIFTAALLIVGSRVAEPIMMYAGAVTGAVTLAAFVAILLNRRGRVSTAVWLLLAAIGLSVPGISLFTASLGWVSVFVIPLLFILLASRALPEGQRSWAVLAGIISGVGALLIDLLGPTRPAFPNADLIIPFVAASLALIVLVALLRQFSYFALQTKLLVLFLAVSLIPLGILAFLNNRASQSNLIDAARQNLVTSATLTSRDIDRFLSEIENKVLEEAQLPVFQSLNSSFSRTTLLENLVQLRQKDPTYIISYALLDRNGNVIISLPVENLPPYLGLPDIVVNSLQVNLVTADPYISPVLYDSEGQASLYVAAPILIASNNQPLGQLIARYDASALQDRMLANNNLAGADSFGVLFDQNLVYLAHGTAPSTLYKSVAPLDETVFERLQSTARLPQGSPADLTTNLPELAEQLRGAEAVFEATDFTDRERINQVGTSDLQNAPWTVAFFQPQDVFLAQIESQTQGTVILVVVIAALVAASSIGASRVLSTPIINLTELVERIAGGDLSIRVPANTRDEIGRLGNTFNNMTSQIRNLLGGLEGQVTERTRELERRATQLQTAAEVARDASSTSDLNQLLDDTVELISERFGFYHAGIFLMDERREFAVLRAANSQGGKQMLARGHKLAVGQVGIVGDTTATGRPHIALDVGEDAAHFAHPLLPETRSEMALPLLVGNEVIGALDVQSKQEGAFDQSDITVLQVLADQLAVAIQNARLLAGYQDTLRELQIAYGQFTQRSWQEWSQLRNRPSGYRYRGAGVETYSDSSPAIQQAWKLGQAVIEDYTAEDGTPNSLLAIPIRLHDETLGVIEMRLNRADVPADLPNLMEGIAGRL
ncbi:MAG: GAF domain-containing protein, partial [Anaerolineales bacterium]|nr:GAF domain-containing protein [Anaerolineales bacterium]